MIKNAVVNIQDETDLKIDKSKVHSAIIDSISVEDIINERQEFCHMVGYASGQAMSSENTSTALFQSVFQLSYQLWNQASLPASSLSSTKSLTLDEFASREEAVDKEFEMEIKLSNSHLESLVEAVPVVETNENNESASEEVSVDKKESDGEDVVILKPHRLEQRNKAHKEKQEAEVIHNQDIIPLDYTTGSKMLINHDKKERKVRTKRNKKLLKRF